MQRKVGIAIFVLLSIVLLMVGMSGENGPVGDGSVASAIATSNPTEIEQETAMRGTAVLGMVVFSLALALWGLRENRRWVWLALWYWPVFFVLHVISFDTYVPDVPFAVLAVVALFLTRPQQPA